MAFTFIRIFYITTPVSDYQTSGLDMMQAWRMINKATENVEKYQEILVVFLKQHLILLFTQIWN